jgi:hypothetical protein
MSASKSRLRPRSRLAAGASPAVWLAFTHPARWAGFIAGGDWR